MDTFLDRSYEKYFTGPDDFIVRELLQPGRKFRVQGGRVQQPNGDFALCLLEKIEQNTLDALEEIAKTLQISPQAMGYAGLKDKHAHTFQYVTIKGVEKDCFPVRLTHGLVTYVQQTHKPLQLGEHAGNRFTITLHGLKNPTQAQERFLEFCRTGIPNTFGPQRFGVHGDNHLKGLAILRGQTAAKEKTKFLLHAYQAALFNRAMDGQRFQGDVTMLGADAPAPKNIIEKRMHDLALQDGVTKEHFRMGTLMCRGAHRPAWVTPSNGAVEKKKPLVLTFTLPKGSYASALLQRL